MNSPAVQTQIQAEIGIGAGVPKLALHRVANLPILCPDIRTQDELVERHQVLQTVRKAEEDRLAKLRQLRSGLAADLLSGRVRTVAA